VGIVPGVLDSTDLAGTAGRAIPRGSSFSVATFNLHAGVDGWGRPFDVVGACRTLDADVLVLQETWTPDGAPGLAAEVGHALGYAVFEETLAAGRLAGPHPSADGRWMKPLDWRGSSHAIYLDSERPLGEKVTGSRRYRHAQPGRWGIAVLSRLPTRGSTVIDLGRLQQDPARRAALVVEVDLGTTPLTVVGTHMSHVTYGAPVQFLRLNRAVHRLAPSGPAVLAGDMNLWGPPVRVFFPGWRRAVRRRTWPAWRPHSQVDHILVRGAVAVEAGRDFAGMGSDHRPVRALLAAGV
jgi:endonuclease/exonuclease/phosphatase family metal-dependent hydrolase